MNSLGNYAFVFGNFGAPALGLQGSALASVFTALFMVAAYVVAIRPTGGCARYHIFGRWWRPNGGALRELLRIGTPIAMTILAEAGLFGGAAFLMGRIGAAELAGHTIALQLAALAFQVPFGVGQAATIRVGYFYGARDRAGDRPRRVDRDRAWARFHGAHRRRHAAAPAPLLSLYVDPAPRPTPRWSRFALQYLAVAAAFQLFDGLQAVAAGACAGCRTRACRW